MYVADACALIVFLTDPLASRFIPVGTQLMRDEVVGVSPITVWEITQKVASGKLSPIWGPFPSLPHLLRAQGYQMRPLAWEDADEATRLPPHHKDPMDRILIATALRANLTIITNDGVFAAYGVKTLW
jgi:PIN domain nuclease of toxin-antitoxin system